MLFLVPDFERGTPLVAVGGRNLLGQDEDFVFAGEDGAWFRVGDDVRETIVFAAGEAIEAEGEDVLLLDEVLEEFVEGLAIEGEGDVEVVQVAGLDVGELIVLLLGVGAPDQ